MTDNIDTTVSNYTLAELMAIVNVNDFDPNQIVKNTNQLISKYIDNPKMASFFRDIQSELLQYSQSLLEEDDEDIEEENDPINKQTEDWYENENLTQKDETQTDKITERKDKTQIYGNEHMPMNREQLGVNDTFSVPVKQDSLNPNLKNTISRFVNLDSQFRQYTNGADSASTDYTLDLSDGLKNVLSLRLYSYQIPFSWYAIDTNYGNTCFWILDGTNTIPISIPSGNYSQTQFQTQLNTSFVNAGFSGFSGGTPVLYNANSGLITLNLIGGTYTNTTLGISFTITEETVILFFDFTGVLQCGQTCMSKSNHYFNSTLGWIMGFRLPYVNVSSSGGNTGTAILDLNGTKYLMLVIDDYNQNHINNGLVSISQFSNTLKVPSYYSPDLPYTCLQPGTNNLQQLVGELDGNNGLLLAGKYENDYTPTQIVLPSAPRTLTQSQIYTINEINKSRNNVTNYLAKAPTTPDILGILPVKTSVGVPTGSLLIEFSGSLQDNKRTYFGPVNIERMAVKLLDDKGNVLNLNGNDWCVTFICECLYQY